MEDSGHVHAPDTLSPGKVPRYPLGRRRGGGGRDCLGGMEKSLDSAGNLTATIQNIAMPIELSRVIMNINLFTINSNTPDVLKENTL
jgi:hypothetical protein